MRRLAAMLDRWSASGRGARIRRCPSARRRTSTAQYKLEVLAAYDAAEPGEKGAVLRREGLYSSRIVDWRARDTATPST